MSCERSAKLVLHTLGGVAHARLTTHPEPFATLEQTMTKLAEALYSIEAELPASERGYQPTMRYSSGSLPD